MASPAIACIGVIGKYVSSNGNSAFHDAADSLRVQDNPLHISLFPPHENDLLELSFLLNSCLDIFEIHQNNKIIEQDLGLLQAVDERLATYGWLTNTGIKFIIVVDMAGRPPAPDDDERKKAAPILGLRDSDLKPVRERYLTLTSCAHVFLI